MKLFSVMQTSFDKFDQTVKTYLSKTYLEVKNRPIYIHLIGLFLKKGC